MLSVLYLHGDVTVMTSCHDVKNRRYSISARRRASEMVIFLFL